MAGREPLAIVGVGCRYPGSEGPDGLWRTLLERREEVAANPGYRARTRAGRDRVPGPGARRRGSIGGVEEFDWRAFRMSPRESRYVDPQQRVLLESAWEALEDAGLPFERVAGTRTAVFVGLMWPDYAKLIAENPDQIAGYATAGVGFALAANRISYFFDLRGPSVSLDVQCASSLVAVALAAGSIWSGEAELALAGGVNLILAADSDLMMARAGILSAAGSCRTFDAGADGFVRSEGAGMIVLKPLAAARADGDRVLAAIRGVACNHDGRRARLTAPSAESQVELVRRACANAGVEPGELDYIELHGTGTQRGDPIEAEALGEAVGPRSPDDPCLVGSVKTNIGHCESAAGVASTIKVALALHNGLIPATVNHTDPHPAIDGRALGIELVTEARPWPERDRPALAGISGLSLGGGNAHVVLEQVAAVAPPLERVSRVLAAGPFVLPLSARGEDSLRRLARAYAEWLESVGEDRAALRAICAAAALRRSHHRRRAAVVGANAAELVVALRRLADAARAQSDALPRNGAPPRVGVKPPASLTGRERLELRQRAAELGAEPVGERCDRLLELDPRSSTEELAASLHRAGCQVRWNVLHGASCAADTLPRYPWMRERLWIDPAKVAEADPGDPKCVASNGMGAR
jgi:acyl transferase domain-containing protein